MASIAHNEICVRSIKNIDLIRHRDKFINLVYENYKINFPHLDGLVKYAEKSYEDMIQFELDNSAVLIGAFYNDTIIGFLWAYGRNVLGENRIHLSHVIIESEYRGCGIGSMLLTKLESLSMDAGVCKIELITTKENIRTLEFYNAKGFNVVRVQLEKELGELNDYR
jgi:ribosomal protein S18 acetylase RimI-like enzyme